MNMLKKKSLVIVSIVLVASFLVAGFAYRIATTRSDGQVAASPTSQPPTQVLPTPTFTPTTNPNEAVTPTPKPVPTLPLVSSPRSVFGIDDDPYDTAAGIPWVRLAYPTCGNGNYAGKVLQTMIQNYHKRGIYVLVITCQPSSTGPRLFNTQPLNDVARSGADAVQCGNEEMKHDPNVTYVAPGDFARYYDLCQAAVHTVRQGVPVLMGALDPHVGGVDFSPLYYQESYFEAVQSAMNTSVHPGGHWSWRSQIVGLIDSWHNGYPSQYVNSLYGLFTFWAQAFNVDLNSGALGKHLWVVEGTGCFKGCGIDSNSSYQVAVSHTLTLITDAQTTVRYGVPFFYFSGRDFTINGLLWPMGVFDLQGHPKPIRQDLSMGARTLQMNCSNGTVNVVSQVQLLSAIYHGCALPGNYEGILES